LVSGALVNLSVRDIGFIALGDDAGGRAIAKFRFLVLVACLLCASGCSSGGEGGAFDGGEPGDAAESDDDAGDAVTCPNDLPDDGDCPGASPSYDLEIAPIIAARCTVCHAPGGVETTKRFSSYAEAYSLRRQMLTQIYGCRMPPAAGTPLSTEERQKMLKWFVCNAPADALTDADLMGD
jgi:hypothetical protein